LVTKVSDTSGLNSRTTAATSKLVNSLFGNLTTSDSIHLERYK
jgi:hypothetical protein